MSRCDRAEALRDYAFDELPAGERPEMERHIAACAECGGELDQLRLTTAALRAVPDREIPQRIAFVSDKVFEPSPMARFFGAFWNSASRLGFASACILGGGLIVSAYHRPAAAPGEVRTIVQTVDVSKQVDEAVTRAVAQVRGENERMMAATLQAVEAKHERDQLALVDAIDVLQRRLNANTSMSQDYSVAGQ